MRGWSICTSAGLRSTLWPAGSVKRTVLVR
jgi:hypothetical protein